MADIQPGYTFTVGPPNNVATATNLNEQLSNAVILPEFISLKTLKDPVALSDELAINDGGVLKKATLQQLKNIIAQAISSAGLADEARIPAGVILDFAGSTAPDGWLLCFGQVISRLAPYDRLFTAIGTTFGAGDGTTTFGLPDMRGRVAAGKDNMGGTSAGRLNDSGLVGHGVASTTLGDAGGSQSHTITTAELAAHNHAFNDYYQTTVASGGGGTIESGTDIHIGEVAASVASGTANSGSNSRHNNVQPTIIMNKIIRYG